MRNNMDNIMNLSEVSKMLDVQNNTVYRLIVATKLPFIENDGRYYFDKKAVKKWLKTVEKKIYIPTGKESYQLKEQQ